MIGILKSTINSTLDLYTKKTSGYFNFSFLFLTYSTIASSFFSLLILYSASKIFSIPGYNYDTNILEIFALPTVLYNYSNNTFGLIILSLGLYAVYLKHLAEKDFEISPTIKIFGNTISSNDWNNYFIMVIFLSSIYTLTYVNWFEHEEEVGIMGVLNTFNDHKWNLFYDWINSIIDLLKIYVPYLFALYILINCIDNKTTWAKIKNKKRNVIAVLLIIMFALESITNNIIFYTNQYIIKLISIPLNVEFVASAIYFIMTIFIMSFFCLGFVGVIMFSLKSSLDEFKSLETDSSNEQTK